MPGLPTVAPELIFSLASNLALMLALSFMLGPAGLLAFAVLRWVWLRRLHARPRALVA